MQSTALILPQDVADNVHARLAPCCDCDGCRVISRALQGSPFYADAKYYHKPWYAEIVRVAIIKQEQRVYRIWIIALYKTGSVSSTVRTVVEHWSTIKGKWVYG